MEHRFRCEFVPRHSDQYPVPALVFHAAAACGGPPSHVGAILGPECAAPALLLAAPLEIDALLSLIALFQTCGA